MNSKIQCPICYKNKAKVFNNSTFFYRSFTYDKRKGLYNNYLCPDCGLIWQNPQPSEKELSEIYADQYRKSPHTVSYFKKSLDIPIQLKESQNSFLRSQAFFNIFKELNLSLPTKGKILDLGGYQGLFAWALASFTGLKAKIIDFNKSGLKFASGFLGIEVQQISKSIRESLLENTKNSFSIISMIHSLEHMRNPMEVVKLSAELLQNDGYLYIEVPNSLGSGLNDPTHLYTFNKNSLYLMLISNNLNPIYIESGSIAHEAEPEFTNDRVVIRALSQKTTFANKDIRKSSNLNYKKIIYRSLFFASVNTINQMITDLFKKTIGIIYKILGWILYDFFPFGKQLFHTLRNLVRR